MSHQTNHRPRIGLPWRSLKEERAGETRHHRGFMAALRKAGGQPVKVSLELPPGKLVRLARTLDAVVLPGARLDIDPHRFRQKIHEKTTPPDVKREKTDITLLKDAFATGKPVLAVCYGAQMLNVYLGGTLLQDIPSEITGAEAPVRGAAIRSSTRGKLTRKIKHDNGPGHPPSMHQVHLAPGRLAKMAGRTSLRINSSHHQSILRPGRGLRVAARSPDNVVEAVEWIDSPQWVFGLQWHPERMGRRRPLRPDEPKYAPVTVALARELFAELVAEARAVADRRRGNLRGGGALHVNSPRSTMKRKRR